MSWTARDGRRFASAIQREKYERWQDMQTRAPGGPAHEEAVRLHGPAAEINIKREGGHGMPTRFVVTSKHQDGYTYHGAHPEDHVAASVTESLIGVNPPMGLDVMKTSRAHPTGPKEERRIAHEDGRQIEGENGTI